MYRPFQQVSYAKERINNEIVRITSLYASVFSDMWSWHTDSAGSLYHTGVQKTGHQL